MYIKLAIKQYFFILFLAIGVIYPNVSHAQLKYSFERINTENGLPANTIKGVQFDDLNRFLWVATESGLVRYNGHSFQTFGDNEASVNYNGRIVSINRKQDGTIFGRFLDESVFYIQNNRPVKESSSLKINYTNEYLNYKYGLKNTNYKGQKISISNKDFKVKDSYYAFLEGLRESKFYKYNSGEFDSLTFFKNKEQGFVLQDRFFIIDEIGKIKELVTEKKGVVQFENRTSKGLLPVNVNKLSGGLQVFQNGKDEVYLLNANFLYKVIIGLNGIEFKIITDQLPNSEFIHFMQMDIITNTIYLGTDNRGLLIGRPSYFTRIMPFDYNATNSSAVYAQVLLSNGNIQSNSGQLFGNATKNGPLVFYRPAATNTYTTSEHQLLMTNSDGIVEYDLLKDRIAQISNDIEHDRNSFIQVDSTIYSFSVMGIGSKTLHGKWKMKLHFVKTPVGFMSYQCEKINNNEILVTTSDGLYKYTISANSFKRIFRDKNGANFRAIYNLRGYYLIGTYGSGVYMFKDGIIKHIPLDPNKYLNFTHCFILDEQDRIWATTNKGLFMSPAKALIDFWEKGPGNIAYKYYGKLDGIDVLEMNGGCNPCAIKLPNGLISIPGIDGLIQFDPKQLSDSKVIPKAFLDKVVINNIVNVPEILDHNLPSNIKYLELQFGVSGMLSQEDFMFEYKSDNDPWVRLGILNTNINIGNPSFGAHKLNIRIRSSNNKKWETQEINFYVDFPWYLNPFMILFYIGCLTSLIYLYIKLRVIMYRRKQAELENEVLNKTHSIRTMNARLTKRNQAKDQVIAIMNHDILTPLKYLHITADNLVNQIQDPNAKKSIQQISSTTKELEYQTANMLNWVKFESLEQLPPKQNFDLHLLVNNLLEFVDPFKQNCDVQLLNTIPPETIVINWPEQLRVLLYNIVMNSLRSTNKGNISISIITNKSDFTIIIQDTGKGMSNSMAKYLVTGKSKDEVENLPKYKTGNGVGYQIIRSLVALMKAKIEINSVEGKGTTVKLYFNQL